MWYFVQMLTSVCIHMYLSTTLYIMEWQQLNPHKYNIHMYLPHGIIAWFWLDSLGKSNQSICSSFKAKCVWSIDDREKYRHLFLALT